METYKKTADVDAVETDLLMGLPFYLFASSLPFMYVLAEFAPQILDSVEEFPIESPSPRNRDLKKTVILKKIPRSF